MRLYPMLRNCLILTACLSGCSTAPADCKPWSDVEKKAMQDADRNLPKSNALHPLIRDYEGICVKQPMHFGPFTL